MGGGNVRHLLVQVYVCICAGECMCLCKGMRVFVQGYACECASGCVCVCIECYGEVVHNRS